MPRQSRHELLPDHPGCAKYADLDLVQFALLAGGGTPAGDGTLAGGYRGGWLPTRLELSYCQLQLAGTIATSLRPIAGLTIKCLGKSRLALRCCLWVKACVSQIRSFRDLDTWQRSMDLVDAVLAALRGLPRVEFDLRRQMSRAVVSIPSNSPKAVKRTAAALCILKFTAVSSPVAAQPESVGSHAAENLRYIRAAMERSSTFTSVPGAGGVGDGGDWVRRGWNRRHRNRPAIAGWRPGSVRQRWPRWWAWPPCRTRRAPRA